MRNEEAVKRPLRLSCLAQSLLQRAPAVASTSEKFAFAEGEITFGQRCRAIGREIFLSLLSVAKRLFADGYSCEQWRAVHARVSHNWRDTWRHMKPSSRDSYTASYGTASTRWQSFSLAVRAEEGILRAVRHAAMTLTRACLRERGLRRITISTS